MSDDEADPELLELLRKSLGLGGSCLKGPAETGVLESAEHVYDNSIDVALDSQGAKAAAHTIWSLMQQRNYCSKTWSSHDLHPKTKGESAVNFIFTMDLLNFSFWSDKSAVNRFCVLYKGKRWTGYWSLVAALQRALDEGISTNLQSKEKPQIAKLRQEYRLQAPTFGKTRPSVQKEFFERCSALRLRRKSRFLLSG